MPKDVLGKAIKDAKVLKKLWFSPLAKEGTHQQRLEKFYQPQVKRASWAGNCCSLALRFWVAIKASKVKSAVLMTNEKSVRSGVRFAMRESAWKYQLGFWPNVVPRRHQTLLNRY